MRLNNSSQHLCMVSFDALQAVTSIKSSKIQLRSQSELISCLKLGANKSAVFNVVSSSILPPFKAKQINGNAHSEQD